LKICIGYNSKLPKPIPYSYFNSSTVKNTVKLGERSREGENTCLLWTWKGIQLVEAETWHCYTTLIFGLEFYYFMNEVH